MKTYKHIKDFTDDIDTEPKEVLEESETHTRKKIISKASLLEEKKRIDNLLSKFNK